MVSYEFGINLFYLMKGKKRPNPIKAGLEAEDQLKKLAVRIKELRKAKGYESSEIFAYDHDIPRAQYGRYEKGQDLRFTSLVKVVDALGLTMKEFFSEGFE